MKPQGMAIPAIRRLSRMMPCLSRGRPPQTEGPVGNASQRQLGLYFLRELDLFSPKLNPMSFCAGANHQLSATTVRLQKAVAHF
jgi:hypothetical protein